MDYRNIAKVISDFSMLPAFILNVENGSFETVSSGSVKDDVFSVFDRNFFLRTARENKALQGYRFVHKTGLSLLFFRCEDNTVLVFGPYYASARDSDFLLHAIEKMYSTELSAQKKAAIMDSIRTKNSFFADAWKEIMCSLLGVKAFELPEIREPAEIHAAPEHDVFSIDESRIIQSDVAFGYSFEKKIRTAVMNGDKEKLYELLLPQNNLSDYTMEAGANIKYRFENNKMSSIKDSQIILNTIMRIASESAGLPPIYLHSISDGISKEINKANNRTDLKLIIEKMINSYCDAINKLGIKNRSYRVTRVQKYIVTNLTKDLTLENLAEVAGTSTQHLSRLFKRECGVTVTEYIRTQRINEAKWLIKTTDYPIVEISDSLGFSSQNYFCNVFKAETGMTPSQYKAKCELGKNPE